MPHAACPPDPRPHRCDFAAPAIARALHRALPGSELIEAEVHRDPEQLAADGLPGSDQNRPWARRDTRFWRALEEVLNREPRLELLLDVHSFPRGSFGSRDVAVLDPSPGIARDPASVELVALLGLAGVDVALWRGSSENEVVTRARSLGVEAVLIEFGEDASPESRDLAISAVAEWARARTAPVRPL